MNYLRGSSVYLTGAIDHSDDPRGWRKKITRELLLPMGVRVYDPLVKPSWLSPAARTNPSLYYDAINRAILRSTTGDTKGKISDDIVYEEGIAPIGAYPQNKSFYGAYDLGGNVWEWVADWYSRFYYRSSPPMNPKGPFTEIQNQGKVIRGGSYKDDSFSIRSTNRKNSRTTVKDNDIGFRLAMDPE